MLKPNIHSKEFYSEAIAKKFNWLNKMGFTSSNTNKIQKQKNAFIWAIKKEIFSQLNYQTFF